MRFDYTKPGHVIIHMVDCIKMILDNAPADMNGKANNPASSHHFVVNPDATAPSNDDKEIFVHHVMQLLYLSQRAQPDIRTAIAFLCGRLNRPDCDELAADGTGTLYWWVDASYTVHPDMKGQTGGSFSMGPGSIYSTSTKQKLVSRSSTKSELIGIHNVLPQMIWTNNYLKAQGCEINVLLYQDNTSTILLGRNGRGSSSKRTRHMDIQYFYITKQVKNKTITLTHCPTNNMIADFLPSLYKGLFSNVLATAS